MVPVLSKQQTSTRPANEILNGSVQKMAVYAKKDGVSCSERVPRNGQERTVFRKSDKRGVNGHRELHGKLRRDNRGDDEDAVEEELRLLHSLFHTLADEREGEVSLEVDA